jgi:HK97 family phage portal protein
VVLGKGQQLVDYYELRPFGAAGGGKGSLRLPPDEIIHFAEPHPFHLIDGYSPLQACAEWLDVDEAITRSQWAAFINQCVPGLHIELGPEYVDPDQEALEKISRRIDEKFQGTLKTGKTIVTPPGAKLNGYTHTPEEMAYLESGDHSRDRALSIFGTPKEITGQQPSGSELSWYAPMLMFCRFTIKPRLEWAGQVLTEKLAARFGEDLRIYWDDPTPNNPEQVNRDIQTQFQTGAITPNEVRAIFGREPYETGGDDPLISRGVSVLPMNTGKHEDFNIPTSEVAKEEADFPEEEERPDPGQVLPSANGGRFGASLNGLHGRK